MMKKIFLCIFASVIVLPLAALRCGDKAVELPRLKYINGQPFRTSMQMPGNKLRIVTFILSRAGNARSTVSMLNAFDRIYRGKLSQCMITPDPESDARTLLPGVRDTGIAFAVDSGRRITMQYMAGSLLYPKSFVIDPKGNIIWAGESVDLGEMLQEYFDGKFDAAGAKKVAPMLEEMQALLKESSERKLKALSDRIFDISPAHPGALRMRLFSLENSGRIPQAWELIQSRIKAVPAKGRLYFTAVDFISRYTYFRAHLGTLLNSFDRNVKESEMRCTMAWEILNRFQFDLTALNFSDRILGSKAPGKPEFRRMWFAARARVACLTGNIDAAINFQKQCAVPGRRDQMLEYYKGAAQIGKNRKR